MKILVIVDRTKDSHEFMNIYEFGVEYSSVEDFKNDLAMAMKPAILKYNNDYIDYCEWCRGSPLKDGVGSRSKESIFAAVDEWSKLQPENTKDLATRKFDFNGIKLILSDFISKAKGIYGLTDETFVFVMPEIISLDDWFEKIRINTHGASTMNSGS